MTKFRGIDDIKQVYRLNRDIFDRIPFFFVFFLVSLCVKVPQVMKKINPHKFFDKFSQGPARDQPGTKIAIMIKAALSVTFGLFILGLMFLFFKNTVKKTKIQVYILPIS